MVSPVAAAGTDYEVGASAISAVGVVSGVECYISGNDPTIRGGAVNPFTMRKGMRGFEICMQNRLPHIMLTESGGADLPCRPFDNLPRRNVKMSVALK